MAQLAAVASVVGTIVGAVGTIAAGQARQRAANFEAAQLEQQGVQELAASQREQQEFKRVKDLALSRQRAVAGASGLSATDPSVLELAADTAQRGAYQENLAIFGGQERRRQANLQAESVRLGGNAAAQGSFFDAAGTILGGVAGFYDKYGRLMNLPGANTQPRYIYG